MKRLNCFLLIVFFCLHSQVLPAIGTWIQKNNFPGYRNGAFGFSIGQKGYSGCGLYLTPFGTLLVNDFWEYDKATDQWTQKASIPGNGRMNAATFTAFGKGFVTTGYDQVNYLQDTWKYDPLTNGWTAVPNFPGTPRYLCTFFNVGDDGYVGMGKTTGCYSDFYRFDGLSNTWNPVASIPGTPRQSAKGFGIDSLGYVVGGADETTQYNSHELWCYSPATDSWLQKADYPGNGSYGLTGFVMNNHGFAGCGATLSVSNPVFSDFYEYDPASDTWVIATGFGGGIRHSAVSMSIGNAGFVGFGSNVGYPQVNYFNDWWTFVDLTGISNEIENTQAVNGYFNTNGDLILQLESPAEKNTRVFVYDGLGKLLCGQSTMQSEYSIVIKNFYGKPGIYYFTVVEPAGLKIAGKALLKTGM